MSKRTYMVGGILILTLASCAPTTGPAPGFSVPDVTSGQSTASESTAPGPTLDDTIGDGDTSTSSNGGGTSAYVPAQDRALAAAEAASGKQFGTEEFGLTMRELTTRAEEVEPLIAQCMAAAGFEYVPVDFTTIRQAMVSDKSAPGLSSSEYLSQHGHGISTQPDKPIVEIGLGEQNRQILSGLSETDQAAYRRTLWGDNEDATFAFGLESEDFSRTEGCTREAIQQVFSPEELAATYFNPADALIILDPRAQAAIEAYTSCMSDAGFSYSHPDDVDFDLQLRYDTLVQGRDHDELSDVEAEQLTSLQEEELAVTAASDECELRHLEPVLDSIEEEFFGRS